MRNDMSKFRAPVTPVLSLSDVTVSTPTIMTTFDGLKVFTLLAGEFLAHEGLGRLNEAGEFAPEAEDWMPAVQWIAALERIGAALGDSVMREIGGAIPSRAQFPPTIDDAASAVLSVDAAYHMNHQVRGLSMFDPPSGAMLDGIGHYHVDIVSPTAARAEVTSAYPCPFDMGIYDAIAARFARNITVVHEPGPCRRQGADRCFYAVHWSV
jgi:hypothetical protein